MANARAADFDSSAKVRPPDCTLICGRPHCSCECECWEQKNCFGEFMNSEDMVTLTTSSPIWGFLHLNTMCNSFWVVCSFHNLQVALFFSDRKRGQSLETSHTKYGCISHTSNFTPTTGAPCAMISKKHTQKHHSWQSYTDAAQWSDALSVLIGKKATL